MKKFITYTLLLILPFAACKKEYKYPEDPKKSRKSPKERLNGTWNISEYTLNGMSIKESLGKVAGTNISTYTLHYYMSYDIYRLDVVGNWKYYYTDLGAFDDYHYLVFQSYKSPFNEVFVTPFKNLPNPTASRWTVTKLYGNDLHLQLVTDTGEYKITFIKQ